MADVEWYYTSGDERVGPVPFAELKELARSGEIDPRSDLVWSRGMTDWATAGDVEGLFSRRAVPTLVQKEEEPYVAPRARQVENWKGSTPSGTGRAGYFIGTAILPAVLWFVITYVVGKLQHEIPERPWVYLPFGLYLFIPVITIFTTVTRLKNLGMSGWWFLGTLVPVLNLWVGFRCFACPADYAYAKKLDGTGWVLAIFYWLFTVVLPLAAVILFFLAGGPTHFKEGWEKEMERAKARSEHLSVPWEVKDGAKPAARPVQQ